MSKKRVKRIVGDVVKIELSDGSLCFGRILDEPLLAFYDVKSSFQPALEDIIKLPVIFKIWVANHAITSGRWEVIGNKELDENLLEPVSFFKQDIISKDTYIYLNGKEVSASKEQCLNLERAAVWQPEHVEDRLRDYYDGTENQWVKSLMLK